jgi:hypothetical protein
MRQILIILGNFRQVWTKVWTSLDKLDYLCHTKKADVDEYLVTLYYFRQVWTILDILYIGIFMSKKSWETPHLMLSCIWGKELLNYRETAKVSIFIYS